MIVRTLRMKFATENGGKGTISLAYCRSDLKGVEVSSAMETLIDSKVFTAGYVSALGADVVERNVVELF